jgi:cold shock CspA family protein
MSAERSSLPKTNSNNKLVGQVKWFNNRAGYGFITMKDEAGVDKDIFVHFSTIKMEPMQYKYLVQGEYVEFELSKVTSEGHEHQAINITGIDGGSLMCETRQLNRNNSNFVHKNQERRNNRSNDRSNDRSNERRPVIRSNDDSGFETVQKRKQSSYKK